MQGTVGDREPSWQAGSTSFDAKAEAELVTLINGARSQYGLPPLMVDQRMTEAARKHSVLMAEHAAIGHRFEGEPAVQTRISSEGLPADSVSENVALSNRGVAAAHDGLMHSPPHRSAILSAQYNTVGVGVLRDGDDLWVTEDFAHKLREMSNPEAEAAVQAAIAHYARSRGFSAPSRKTELRLRAMACSMAAKDRLESEDALRLTGAQGVLVWTATDPADLPKGMSQTLSRNTSQDALGACFAPSKSHPGGVYWIVLVTY